MTNQETHEAAEDCIAMLSASWPVLERLTDPQRYTVALSEIMLISKPFHTKVSEVLEFTPAPLTFQEWLQFLSTFLQKA